MTQNEWNSLIEELENRNGMRFERVLSPEIAAKLVEVTGSGAPDPAFRETVLPR